VTGLKQVGLPLGGAIGASLLPPGLAMIATLCLLIPVREGRMETP